MGLLLVGSGENDARGHSEKNEMQALWDGNSCLCRQPWVFCFVVFKVLCYICIYFVCPWGRMELEDSIMGVGALLPRESQISHSSLEAWRHPPKVCVFRVVRSVVGTRCDAQVADAETDPEKGGLP